MLIKLDLLPEFYADENVPEEDKYELRNYIDEYFRDDATQCSVKKIQEDYEMIINEIQVNICNKVF